MISHIRVAKMQHTRTGPVVSIQSIASQTRACIASIIVDACL